MSTNITNSQSNFGRREFTGRSMRAGVAKDQLIFIIVCSVALAVAAVTLVHHFAGGSKVSPSQWQCLDCGHEFTLKKIVTPPVECPKCGGEAVRLGYRTCPECKAKVLVSRMRLTKEAQAARPGDGSPMGPMGLGMGMMSPTETQYWVKQADGSYGWTDWMLAGSPQARQIDASLECPECGAKLSSQPARPARPGKSR